MNAYDCSPLFRYGLGFERMQNALESAALAEQASYPVYDIIRTGDGGYRITVVAPGFCAANLNLDTRGNVLLVEAAPPAANEARTYLHQGFKMQGFKQSFRLANCVKAVSARFDNGLLHIDWVREVPEALKPRKIRVETASRAPAKNSHCFVSARKPRAHNCRV
ncbi:MAG: Hsp20 family protein [Gammaproteobacteria bacterium]|nr:Hsp20 family protein [Gammaproteobacteria bacterium]